jgi:hypothetical protein
MGIEATFVPAAAAEVDRLKKELDDVVAAFTDECGRAAASAAAAMSNESAAAAASGARSAAVDGGAGLFPEGPSMRGASGSVWSAAAPARNPAKLDLLSELENEDEDPAPAPAETVASTPITAAATPAASSVLFPDG